MDSFILTHSIGLTETFFQDTQLKNILFHLSYIAPNILFNLPIFFMLNTLPWI